MQIVNLPKRIETGLISGSDQTVRSRRSCNSWFGKFDNFLKMHQCPAICMVAYWAPYYSMAIFHQLTIPMFFVQIAFEMTKTFRYAPVTFVTGALYFTPVRLSVCPSVAVRKSLYNQLLL